MKKIIKYFALTFSLTLNLFSQTGKPFFEQFKFTVALVETVITKNPKGDFILTPIGTAFWVSDSSSDASVLVSNKHVFGNSSEIVLSQYSSSGQTSALIVIQLKDKNGNKLWVEHPDSMTDIAAIKVKYFQRIGQLRAEIIQISTKMFAKSDEIIEGDDVFILGFPMGIRTSSKSFPLVRSGVLSLKPTEDFLILPNGGIIGRNIYLLDANILGGNSGSPVFLKPVVNRPFLNPRELGRITQPKLIGIVSAYVNDFLPLVKAQPSIYAQGNSGITIVHRSEEILKVVMMALKK